MRRLLFAVVWFFVAASLFHPSPACSQERNGTVTGHVLDPSRAVLPGAKVELRAAGQTSGQTAVVNSAGEFTLSGVAPGHYTLLVSAVGFATFTNNEVNVASGGVANVEALLQVEGKTEVIEVRAEREHGEVEALNRERTADNIVQVLPAEVITSLPNTNIADAVGRLPSVSLERDEGEGKYVQIRGTEPRLSNVTVDGVHLASPENVRNVKLDAIPADLVEAVELNKTLSANQDGDAIGGSVNLVTKSASDKPYISVEGTGGVTPIAGGRNLYTASTTLGQRFFQKKLGVMVGGSWDWNGRGIDDQEFSVGSGSTASAPNSPIAVFTSKDTREYWYDRTRFGFGGTLDYKIGDWSSAYIRGLFSQFKDDGQDWIYTANTGALQNGSTFANEISDNTGNETFSHVTRKPAQRLFSTAAGAHHTFGKTLLNYEVAFGQARFTGFFPSYSFNGPGNLDTQGNPITPNGPAFTVDASHPFTPLFNVTNGVNIFDPTLYTFGGFNRGDDHTFERDVTGSISLTRNYNVGSHFSTFEIGMKVRDAHKSEDDLSQTFAATQNFLRSSVLGTFTNSNYYFGVYPLGPVTSLPKILTLINSNPGAFLDDPSADSAQNFGGDFTVDERVTAGYVMDSINFSRFRLTAGVRIEATQASYLANHFQTSRTNDPQFSANSASPFAGASEIIAGSLSSVPGSQDYIDALPSVQLQTRLGNDTVIRLAYGMGIARPNFSDLPPRINEDLSNPTKPTVSIGNPALKPTHAQNVDLLFEHYLKPIGVIEGGVFYKYLTDPIYNARTFLTTGQFANFFQTQPVNGAAGHLTGVEFAWQQRLAFLPSIFRYAGVRANYSYTNSTSTFPPGAFAFSGCITGCGRTDHPALQRQAPNNWNFDTTYDVHGFSARMGLSHNDANIFQYTFQQNQDLGLKGPNGDVYLYPHTQVDVQASYWLPHAHGFQLIGYVLNLTNETFGFYQGSEQFPIQREYYNRTFAGGMRWSPSREH